jgi:hypothetical protein
MSLIVTHISALGVLQIADSALTVPGPPAQDAGDANKIFDVPALQAAISVAGSYSVGSVPLDVWLSNFIAKSNSNTLGAFATELASALTNQVFASQSHLVHLAGFGATPMPGAPPEFWLIGNFDGIDEASGEYVGRNAVYGQTEDFLNRDLKAIGGWEMFCATKAEFAYVNGLKHGRVAFNTAFVQLDSLDRTLINDSDSKLRLPGTIEEMRDRVVKRFELVSDIYSRNLFGARVIGGPTNFIAVPSA